MSEVRKLSPRVRVHSMATLIDNQGNRERCVLIDLSAEGFRAELVNACDPQSFAKLDTGRGIYRIEVRWATGLELGGRVLEHLS